MGHPRQNVSVVPLVVAMELLKWDTKRTAEELGYSSSSLTNWIRLGECPRVVVLAMERLLDGRTLDGHLPVQFVLLQITDNIPVVVWSGLILDKATIGTRTYLLIPQAIPSP